MGVLDLSDLVKYKGPKAIGPDRLPGAGGKPSTRFKKMIHLETLPSYLHHKGGSDCA